MRWPIIVVGVSCSLVAGCLTFRLLGEADDEVWAAMVGGAGIVITLKIANALVGGGRDTEV